MELTHDSISLNKIRYYLVFDVFYDKVDVDVYYNNSWHDVYEGSFATQQWIEKDIPGGIQTISKARLRLYTKGNYRCYLTEFDFGQTGGTFAKSLDFAKIFGNIENQLASISNAVSQLLEKIQELMGR